MSAVVLCCVFITPISTCEFLRVVCTSSYLVSAGRLDNDFGPIRCLAGAGDPLCFG